MLIVKGKILITKGARDSQIHIDRIRAMLKATDKDFHGEGAG